MNLLPRLACHGLVTLILVLILAPLSRAQVTPGSNHVDPWQKWQRHDPNSTKHIDHSIWENFLATYLTKERNVSRIRYRAVTTHHRNHLYDYLWLLSKQQIETYNRQEQLAFWLNLYNATVVKMILEHYPIASLDEIQTPENLFKHETLFKHNALNAQRIHINHTSLSLNDIKYHIILSVWPDPRLLYATSNGTLGAPSLLKHAFSAQKLEGQLTQAAYNFINAQRTLKITQHKLIASRVFKEYIGRFGQTELDLIQHLKQYATPSLSEQLKSIRQVDAYVTNEHINDAIYEDSSMNNSIEGRLEKAEQIEVDGSLLLADRYVRTDDV